MTSTMGDALASPGTTVDALASPGTTGDASASPAVTPVQHPEPTPDRLPNGRFAPGNQINPFGRPRGSRNKASYIMEELIYSEGPTITDKLLALARNGDLRAMKLCLERVLPPVKESPIEIDLPPITTLSDVVNAHTALIEAVSRGEIELHQATRMGDLLELKRKAIESIDLERRLVELEEHAAQAKNAGFRPW